ncbi:LEM-3-like GIY-YIG domain-containing protein [Epibacterium sp. Ofav1-8]|uniref:LEM-3-like GIY-YIG domain-containing protein n=1 Tax=Epibacterium sp. Ofav1-8 TaxID=2917735 RepID=UPI001EF5CD6B|nr:hypothetical protein [Epibacterium sp. Ofav1-8]MCG7623067.1 hypothetical protein [Epibacterium sp. Ofav1-8]
MSFGAPIFDLARVSQAELSAYRSDRYFEENQLSKQVPYFENVLLDRIGHYVYALIDPCTDKIFYIGEGKGNRLYSHVIEEQVQKDAQSEKLDMIGQIKRAGKDVEYLILRHGLNKDEARLIESVLIDVLRHRNQDFAAAGLTNIQSGHGARSRGLMTADEIQRRYVSEELKSLPEQAVLININREYTRFDDSKGVLEAVKGNWVMAKWRTEQIKYVLAEFQGFVIEVFEVKAWHHHPEIGRYGRYSFSGQPAPDDVRNRYLNRRVPKKRGQANPIRYTL